MSLPAGNNPESAEFKEGVRIYRRAFRRLLGHRATKLQALAIQNAAIAAVKYDFAIQNRASGQDADHWRRVAKQRRADMLATFAKPKPEPKPLSLDEQLRQSGMWR